MEEHIQKLESLLTLQDNTISELNAEVFRQQQDIAHLQNRIEAMERKIEQLEEPREFAGNEKPPHW